MISVDLIHKVNSLIDTLNSNQQSIARNILIDSNYQILELEYQRRTDIFIKDLKSIQIYHFVTFIKSKCNCD
jgi:hypothetical protein